LVFELAVSVKGLGSPSNALPIRSTACSRDVQALKLDALVGRQWSIVACSAVDGIGLLEGFQWLVKDVASRIYLLD
jgi:hypothetical protein